MKHSLLTILAAAVSWAQAPAPPDALANLLKAVGVPIDIGIPMAPAPFPGEAGGLNLAYELHLLNVAPAELHLSKIEVLDGSSTLAGYEGADLSTALQRFGGDVPDKRALGPGMAAVAYIWVKIPPGGAVPRTLRNRLTVDGYSVERTVSVSTAKPMTLGPPLRGSDWLAANGPSNTSIHRRALMPIEGSLHIAQRFAIDWVQLGADDKTFTGDVKDNKNYHAYGHEALAVANATVVEIKDGIPENVPGENSRAVPITTETVGGNHVVLDLGGGRYAFYAHFQPGSLRVKTGDKVRRGQVLGLVGNSGNSSEPHLHFHVSDALSPLGSEGVPFVLESFEVLGAAGPERKMNALPLENVRVRFADR